MININAGQRHSHRRVSIELEDLDLRSSTGQFFPPLQPSQRSTRSFVSGQYELGSSPRQAESFWSLKTTCSSPKDKELEFWVGEPEAISSIRRPRRSVSQLKRDQALSRSQSLKDGAYASGTGLSPPQSIQRSHSLREPTRKAGYSWSRSSSLKEKCKKSEESTAVNSVTQDMGCLEVGTKKSKSKRFQNRSKRRRHTATCSLGSSPEAKGISGPPNDDNGFPRSHSSLSQAASIVKETYSKEKRSPPTVLTGEKAASDSGPLLPPVACGATCQGPEESIDGMSDLKAELITVPLDSPGIEQIVEFY